jgi:hypothetical protein
VGGYRIEEYVTDGGWARLYRARRETSGKHFAFKTILPHLARDPEYTRLFKREQDILDSLEQTHPNIGIALDWSGPDGDYLWLALPWIDGRTLQDSVFVEGPLEPSRAARLLAEAADGLDFVHSADRGLIHNDLHPGNLMVDRRDRMRVIDFGLAKRYEHPSGSPFPPREGRWNSPEALAGKQLDPRADIYSLGLLLAFALTGAKPAIGSLELPAQPTVPDGLREVIETAAAPEPGERYESAAEMAAALRQWLEPPSQPPSPPPAPPPVAKPAPLAIPKRAVIAAAVIAAAITFLLIALVPFGDEPAVGVEVATAEASATAPADWARAKVSAADRRRGLAVAVRGPVATVYLGSVPRSRLPAPAPGDAAFDVSLPAGRALRIDDAETMKAARLYAFGETGGAVVLVCRVNGDAEPVAVDRACGRVAESVRLRHRAESIRYPERGFRRRVADALQTYAAARRQGAKTIESAVSAEAVATVAEKIADDAADAAKRAQGKQLLRLRAGLNKAAMAWRAAAAAARKEDHDAYAKAGDAVANAERAIRQARSELVALGYRP